MNIKVLLFIITLSFFSSIVWASIEGDMKTFFDKVGMQSNINSPSAYQDQAAGYYTGGSLMARNDVRNAQLATMQMPGYRAGCGGIDAWTGGASHIKTDEIMNFLSSLGSSAGTFAFLLSMEIISPVIYNLLNELNAIATQVNALNVNSCEAAATLLGGVWPKSDQSSKHLCQAMGSNLGAFSDWSAARQGCGAKGDREAVFGRKGSDPRYKDMLVGEFNLSWKALQLNSFLSQDKALAELFMTLVGSIISKKKGEGYESRPLPGHGDREDVLTGLLMGGTTPIYRCDSDECLNPALKTTTIPEKQALLRKVRETLDDLVKAIYQDTEITTEQKDFLNATRLPVYKMLNVMTAYRQDAAPLNIHEYTELIALDILYKYVLEVIDIVQDSLSQLKSVQVDNAKIEPFIEQLHRARERIVVRRGNAFQQMDTVLSFVEATQLVEKQLHVMLGNVANENNWY
jgi:conjugative transfer pilus assembly protein TraH